MARSLLAAMLALGACSSAAPGVQGRAEAVPPAGARGLLELGEFLAAREALRALPGDAEAAALLRRIETMAGVQGVPPESEVRARIALFEVLSHFSTGQELHDREDFRRAADQFERGLAEIEKFGLQNRFPRALRSTYEAQLRQARARERR